MLRRLELRSGVEGLDLLDTFFEHAIDEDQRQHREASGLLGVVEPIAAVSATMKLVKEISDGRQARCIREMVTADRQAFFKFMVKSIAEKHGLRATLMRSRSRTYTGNGCHAHVSAWNRMKRRNLFLDKKDELGLSKLAHQFLGGVLHHAEALCAITNPSVNSYKRINAPVTTSGATWSDNNRTHMVRIPDPGRFEFRLADGAVNRYLLHPGIIAAGRDGIDNDRSPGKPSFVDMYVEGHKVRARRLPLYLLDAVRAFDGDNALKATLGDSFSASYVKLKMQEWDEYSKHLTEWERTTTQDC